MNYESMATSICNPPGYVLVSITVCDVCICNLYAMFRFFSMRRAARPPEDSRRTEGFAIIYQKTKIHAASGDLYNINYAFCNNTKFFCLRLVLLYSIEATRFVGVSVVSHFILFHPPFSIKFPAYFFKPPGHRA